jgi:hypothetical protein
MLGLLHPLEGDVPHFTLLAPADVVTDEHYSFLTFKYRRQKKNKCKPLPISKRSTSRDFQKHKNVYSRLEGLDIQEPEMSSMPLLCIL